MLFSLRVVLLVKQYTAGSLNCALSTRRTIGDSDNKKTAAAPTVERLPSVGNHLSQSLFDEVSDTIARCRAMKITKAFLKKAHLLLRTVLPATAVVGKGI